MDDIKSFLEAKKELKLATDKLHTLYESWSKEKASFLQCCTDLQELLSDYNKTAKTFQEIPEKLTQEFKQAVQDARSNLSLTFKQNLIEQANQEISTIALQLKSSAEKAERALLAHERALSYEHTQLKIIGITFLTAILTACLIAWLLIPKPLTAQQINDIHDGQIINKILPKLTKKELERLDQLTREVKQVKE